MSSNEIHLIWQPEGSSRLARTELLLHCVVVALYHTSLVSHDLNCCHYPHMIFAHSISCPHFNQWPLPTSTDVTGQASSYATTKNRNPDQTDDKVSLILYRRHMAVMKTSRSLSKLNFLLFLVFAVKMLLWGCSATMPCIIYWFYTSLLLPKSHIFLMALSTSHWGSVRSQGCMIALPCLQRHKTYSQHLDQGRFHWF